MNVIMHFPESEDGKIRLANRVTNIHTEFIVEYLNKSDCETEDIFRILEGIQKIACSYPNN